MAKFCSKCGAQMDDNLMFCGNCGAQQGAAAPAATAPAAAPFANLDYKGILTGKTDEKTNWLVALALQVLSLILFLLPIFSSKVKFGDNKEVDTWGFFGDHFEDSGLRAFPLVLFIVAIAAVIYMLVPVLKKTQFNYAAALVMFVAQTQLWLGTLFLGIKFTDKMGEGDYVAKSGLSVAGIIYLVIGAVAIFAVGRLVFQNRKKLA
ncbi:MAG: zinc ribbon domain-containing protein [Ruminococcus sp.]|nr:zinc ribbon domain-containing protein [Ruminococcus sp.]